MPGTRRACLSIVAVLSALLAPDVAAASTPDRLEPGGQWSRLGGDLLPTAGSDVTALSLAGAPGHRPVLSLSTWDPAASTTATAVHRWAGSSWAPLGAPQPAGGGSTTVGRHGRPWLCAGAPDGAARRGPVVWRWTAAGWSQLGGDVAVEAGYADGGGRYNVQGCSGPVFDRSGAPVVTWVAHVGARAHFLYAARWDAALGRWVGLDPGPRTADDRATAAYADIDDQGRLYVAAYRPGPGYGGPHTSVVYGWNGASWARLGDGWTETDRPVVVGGGDGAYLAYRVRDTGRIEVAQWAAGAWRALPSPGLGAMAALELSRSGELVAAIAPGPDDQADGVRVAVLRAGAWHTVGGTVSGPVAGEVTELTLAIDGADRPTVAWAEYLEGSGYRVFAAAQSRSIR